MAHPEWKTLISECFLSTNFMALATQGSEGIWVNPVYFAWDDDYSIYFISQMDCCHMRNIQQNQNISCAIYPTDQAEFVRGAYLKGSAKILDQDEEMVQADRVYYGRIYGDNEDAKLKDSYREDPSWVFVQIKLKELTYFDTRYFKENRVEVPKEVWFKD